MGGALRREVERFDHTVCFDSASASAQTMRRSPVGFAALEAEGGEARHRLVASSVEALFRGELAEGAVQVPLSGWLSLGIGRVEAVVADADRPEPPPPLRDAVRSSVRASVAVVDVAVPRAAVAR